MRLPNPSHSTHELDRLMREALRARVGGQEPPERVWKRIKLELSPDRSPLPRLRVRWSPVMAQIAFTVLLVILAGAGLQMNLISGDTGRLLSSAIPTSVTSVYVSEYSTSLDGLPRSSESGTYSLKAHYEANPVQPVSAGPISYKPALAPWDAVPVPVRVESRSPSPASLAPNRFLHDGRNEK